MIYEAAKIIIKIANMLKNKQYLKQLFIIDDICDLLPKESSSEINLVEDKFIPDKAIHRKNENTDIIIPNIPSVALFILLDKNILKAVAINFKNNVEIVRSNPFFMKVLIFFIQKISLRVVFRFWDVPINRILRLYVFYFFV